MGLMGRGNVDIMQMLSKAQDEYDKVRHLGGPRWTDGVMEGWRCKTGGRMGRGNVDIMQMLSKAQDEYDKVRCLCVSWWVRGDGDAG